MYLVNEIFYSIQGEGYWTGRPAVFVRFSRCNLWTGRDADRERAVCKFCDTDFSDGTPYVADAIIDAVKALWPDVMGSPEPMVVFTGGEPTLQLDRDLAERLSLDGWFTAIETNGTRTVPVGVDWICVSPKAGANLVQARGDELKVVWPQRVDLDHYWYSTSFDHYWLSPMDGPHLAENTARCLDYVLADPRWRLNIQTHKVVGCR